MKTVLIRTLVLLVLFAVGVFAVADDEDNRAMLVGSPGFPARDLFELEFTAIDGRNIPPQDVLWVEAGKRMITVRVPERYTESQINQQRQKWADYVDIELELKPGHVYELRGRYNRTNRDNAYDIIVESVRPAEDG